MQAKGVDKEALWKNLCAEIEKNGSLESTLAFANAYQYLHDDVVGVAKSYNAQNKIVMSAPLTWKGLELTTEGREALEKGSPEYNFLVGLPAELERRAQAAAKKALEESLATAASTSTTATVTNDSTAQPTPTNPNATQGKKQGAKGGGEQKQGGKKAANAKGAEDSASQVGQAWALKNNWIAFKDGALTQLKQASEVTDTWRLALEAHVQGKENAKDVDVLKKRKWLAISNVKFFSISKGPAWEVTSKLQNHLTMEQIADGSWTGVTLKPLNFEAQGASVQGGFLHPLMKVREEFRLIFLELGYEEMKSNRFVESSFWNFDSLFQPQQHPARDSHDTFFLTRPEKTLVLPDEYYARVKEVHERGGYGSVGWRYNFSDDEPRKNILRTHTTANSSRTLYALAQQPVFTPKKYFSIERVYRNESLDSTHLAEFHQIEGFIADYNISLSSLMGAISEFYKKIGITRIKFKPAYNPYTEPSMEIFGYSEERKGWMEIGNSGIFRPEMLLPLGLPPDVGVAAWGLSLERPTMIKYHLSNIRELFGHKVSLNMVANNPFCMFGAV